MLQLMTSKSLYFVTFCVCCFVMVFFYTDTSNLSNYSVLVNPEDENYTNRFVEEYFSKLNNANIILPTTPEVNVTSNIINNKDGFLVYSSKCKIIDLDPFNNQAKPFIHLEKYTSCRKQELLTYITKTDNEATLHIDQDIVPSYSKKGVSCCYSNVTRDGSKQNPDDGVKISKCEHFNNSVTIHSEVITVKCTSDKSEVYKNTHVIFTIKKNVQKKIETIDNTTKPISILFVGIDSISRLNLIRTMPNTYRYLTENDWLPLKGYNKMDDNTFPNVMAILTGFNQTHAYSICNPKKVGLLDKCPILWYDYGKLGYITGYAEDESWINTFNYRKKGFSTPPTDYYLRPYMIAAEKLKTVKKDGMTYCTGPETSGERILNAAKEFSITLKDYASFGFFWMNTFSHNDLNSPSGMDNKVRQFLEDLSNSGVLENSIVIFLSDHGIRFGLIRRTPTGWLEERLPFIYVSFPPWFKQHFSKEYENFKNNAHKLTTPYDLHMTLQHILVMSGFNYTTKQSDACPKCKSLFEKIETERSCEDAGIEQHWCTCSGYKTVQLENKTSHKLGDYVISQIHDVIHSKKSDAMCAKYSVSKVISVSLSEQFSYKNDTYVLLVFETNPSAVFETTINFKGHIDDGNYTLSGDISRLDTYSTHSKCTNDAYLKKYCYCI